MRRFRELSLLLLFDLAAIAGQPALAQARKRPSPDVPAEKFYKNIQVFQRLPSDQLTPAMNFMAASLGVRCTHCHVKNDTGRWPMEKDDKETKLVARKMIAMTRDINKANFGGRTTVTCATCHAGKKKP